jgi:hypothetical protein
MTVALAVAQDPIELVKYIGLYVGLVTAVFRLGALREQLTNTTQNVSTDMTRVRDDMAQGFSVLHRRLDKVDDFTTASTEHRLGQERFQERVDVRQEAFDRRLTHVEDGRDARRPIAA